MELDIIEYCARECERQGSGEVSVFYMCYAWEWAQEKWEFCFDCSKDSPNYGNDPHDRKHTPITLDFIEYLGQLVEPTKNRSGFRRIPIGVNDPNLGWLEKADWERVPDLLQALLDSYYGGNFADEIYPGWQSVNGRTATAEEQFYYEYENIHPFRDGNGRTGKIIYNYLCGTLDNPVMPPNFWNAYNP